MTYGTLAVVNLNIIDELAAPPSIEVLSCPSAASVAAAAALQSAAEAEGCVVLGNLFRYV